MEIETFVAQFGENAIEEALLNWRTFRKDFPDAAKKGDDFFAARVGEFDGAEVRIGMEYCDAYQDIDDDGNGADLVHQVFAKAGARVQRVMVACEAAGRLMRADKRLRGWLVIHILPLFNTLEELTMPSNCYEKFKFTLTATTMAELTDQLITQSAAILPTSVARGVRPFMEKALAINLHEVTAVLAEKPSAEALVVARMIEEFNDTTYIPDEVDLGWAAKRVASKLKGSSSSRDASPVRKANTYRRQLTDEDLAIVDLAERDGIKPNADGEVVFKIKCYRDDGTFVGDGCFCLPADKLVNEFTKAELSNYVASLRLGEQPKDYWTFAYFETLLAKL